METRYTPRHQRRSRLSAVAASVRRVMRPNWEYREMSILDVLAEERGSLPTPSLSSRQARGGAGTGGGSQYLAVEGTGVEVDTSGVDSGPHPQAHTRHSGQHPSNHPTTPVRQDAALSRTLFHAVFHKRYITKRQHRTGAVCYCDSGGPSRILPSGVMPHPDIPARAAGARRRAGRYLPPWCMRLRDRKRYAHCPPE